MSRLRKVKFLKLGISRKLKPSVGRKTLKHKHAGQRKTTRTIKVIKITSKPIQLTSSY